MKHLNYIIVPFLIFINISGYSQSIVLNACHPLIENQDYTFLHKAVDATGRNIFETTPINDNSPCGGIGNCELQIAWNTTNNRWEIFADDGNGTFSNTYVLYYNTEASIPNPPSLTLGVWVEMKSVTQSLCGSIKYITGDVADATPSITSAAYNFTTGSLVVTGVNFEANAGASNDVSVSKLTLTGESGATYTLTSADVELDSATQFTANLNATDQLNVNGLLNKNGTTSDGSTTYNLAAADNFITNFTTGDTSDATNAVTVSNYAMPTITSATYDVSTKTLVVTGTNFAKLSGTNNDIDVSKLSIVGNGGEYALTAATDVDVTSQTQFSVTLTDADAYPISGVLNKNGTTAGDSGATTYNIKAAEDWQKAAAASATIVDAGTNAVTVSNTATPPTITSSTYDASTGVLVVTGTNLTPKIGATNDVDVSTLTLTGQAGGTRTLTSSDVELTAPTNAASATSFSVTLNSNDKTAVNNLLNKNGTAAVSTTTYNLAAAEDWLVGADLGAAIADATGNTITASNVVDKTATVTAGAGGDATTIASTVTDMNSSVNVYDVTINDGATASSISSGTSDAFPTKITAIKFNASGSATAAHYQDITWRLNGPDVTNITGSYTTGVITFSGLNISVSNGGSETYTVNAYYNDNTAITDNATFILSLDGDSDITLGSGSTLMAATTPVTNGSLAADVTATKLTFTTMPAGSVSGKALTTQPVIKAQDAVGNIDTDFTETITLTEGSAGTLTGNTKMAANGVATFSGLTYKATADQQDFTLTADDEGSVGSNLATINASSITSDIVATKLVFTQQPAPLSVTSGEAVTLTTVPVVQAQDAEGLVDTGYSTSVVLAKVNGAGSATMSATGTSSASSVTLTPTSGVTTFTGMSLTYTASGSSDETFNLQATSTGLTSADSSQMTAGVFGSDATVTAVQNASFASTLGTTIVTANTTALFGFTITDGGSGNVKPTNISAVKVGVSGTSTDAERGKVTWRLNGADVNQVTGIYDAATDTITFSGLTLSVANGASENYTINGFYNDNTAISDGHTFILSTDGDTDFTLASGSTKMAATTPVTNGTGFKADVVATKLAFTTQPAGSVSGKALTTQPVIKAQDAVGNIDIDFTETITLTEGSAGTLTGNTKMAANGVATFSGLTYKATADQQDFTLTADDEGSVGSNLATINASSITSDIVATKLVFTQQPAPLSVTSGEAVTLTTVPVVQAQDADGLVDTGYSTSVVLAKVNGAGSATMSATGTSSASSVTLTPTSGVTTFTGMSLTYTASGSSDETFNLQATSTGLTSADSSQMTAGVFGSDATVTAVQNASFASTLGTTIVTANTTALFGFTITDGGSGNVKPTNISAVKVGVSGTSTDAERGKVTWRLNGADVNQVTGTYDAATDTITFSGLTLSVANGASENYTINGFYNDNTAISDGHTFILSTDGDTDFTLASGSTKMAATTPVTNGTGFKADVVATKLAFTTQPAGSVSGKALTTQPVIKAQDAVGNIDIDFTETITLTEDSAGTLTSNTATAVAGVATFSGLAYKATADNQSFTLTADDVAAGGDLTAVSADALVSNVVATTLVFDKTLAPAVVNSGQSAVDDSFTAQANTFTQVPVIAARDADGIVDVDYVTPIVLSQGTANTGSVTELSASNDTDSNASTVTLTPVDGVTTFTDFTLSYKAGSATDTVQIVASDSASLLSNASDNSIAVNIIPYITEATDTFSVSVDEDVKTALDTSDIKVNDADADELTVVVTVDKGTLFATDGDAVIDVDGDASSSTDSVTITNSGGTTGSKAITLVGKAVDINTFLNGSRFSYQTVENDTASPTLTLTVKDALVENTVKLTETIAVTAINDAPVISGTPATSVNQGEAYSFTPSASDIETASSALTFTITNKPTWAAFATATGALTGTPTNNDVGTTSNVTISVTDGDLTTELTGFAIKVVNVNDAPTANAQSLVTDEDTAKVITLAGVDIDGDSLTYNYTQPAHGMLSGTAPNLTYMPAANYAGSDSFTFKVNDGAVDSATSTVTITVTAVNDAPVATAQSVTTNEDTAKAIMLAGTDVEGSTLTYSSTQPMHGTLTGTGPNLTYTPTANYSGSDSFTFTVNDGTVDSVASTVTITVTAVNDIPVATAQSVTTNEDTAKAIMLVGSDADVGDTLTYSNTQPMHGTLTGTAPNLTYTPTANYSGSDSFTFKVNDGTVDSATSTVTITVTAVNDAPVATAQSVTTNEDTAMAIMLAGTDVEGSTLTYSNTQPMHGTLTGTAPNLTYTPTANYSGSDSFTFKVNDGAVDSATSTVTITVTAVNDAPVATAQSVTTNEDTATAIMLVGSDADVGDTLTYSNTQPMHGTLTGTAPNLTYTPTANYSGSDSFTFTVNDGTVDSVASTVTITVTAVNDIPVATAQSVTTNEDTAMAIMLAGTDVEGSTLTYSNTQPMHGTLTGTAPNLTYTPTANYSGSDSFTFTVNDGTVDSAASTVTITVTAVNDAPTITGTPAITVNYGAVYSFTPITLDIDNTVEELSFSIMNKPIWATFNASTGTLSGTPSVAHAGTTSGIVITVSDGELAASLPAFIVEVIISEENSLAAVVGIISGDGASITATQLNAITGVSGAIDGVDYSVALAAGTYADASNPTAAEIQAVIDNVNAQIVVVGIISGDGASITATQLNAITGVSGAIDGVDYSAALAAGTYADASNPTAAEIQAVIDNVNAQIVVVGIISGDGASITATQLNAITGVSGAIDGVDYSAALAAGTYVDASNPTAAEIQAIIDAVNAEVAALAEVADDIAGNDNGVGVTAAQLNSITGVSRAQSGVDYTTALAAGTYADESNPTAAEIQAVIDAVNSSSSKATKYGFSPNGDGINDTWTVDYISLYPNNTVKVYNRSGRLVFEQKGYDNTWNGVSNKAGTNKRLPAGPYLFTIDLKSGEKLIKGWLYINY